MYLLLDGHRQPGGNLCHKACSHNAGCMQGKTKGCFLLLQVCLLNYRKDGSTFLNQFFLSPMKVSMLKVSPARGGGGGVPWGGGRERRVDRGTEGRGRQLCHHRFQQHGTC
jgi:hypothetical protein